MTENPCTPAKTKPLIAEWFLKRNMVLNHEARGDAEVRKRASRVPRPEEELTSIPIEVRDVLVSRIRIDVHAGVAATDDAEVFLVAEALWMRKEHDAHRVRIQKELARSDFFFHEH